jgi:hypothetical protein
MGKNKTSSKSSCMVVGCKRSIKVCHALPGHRDPRYLHNSKTILDHQLLMLYYKRFPLFCIEEFYGLRKLGGRKTSMKTCTRIFAKHILQRATCARHTCIDKQLFQSIKVLLD